MRDPMDELVEALIADGEMEKMQTYLEAGRAYASATVEVLNQRWVTALTAVAYGDDSRLDDLCDLEAELRLRGLPTPEQLVPQETTAALQGRVLNATPEDFATVAENIRRRRARWGRDAVRPS